MNFFQMFPVALSPVFSPLPFFPSISFPSCNPRSEFDPPNGCGTQVPPPPPPPCTGSPPLATDPSLLGRSALISVTSLPYLLPPLADSLYVTNHDARILVGKAFKRHPVVFLCFHAGSFSPFLVERAPPPRRAKSNLLQRLILPRTGFHYFVLKKI